MDIKALAKEAESYIIDRRRYYHACPELTWEEKETRASMRRDLEALGITDIREMQNCYGLIATIHGGQPGKTIALRTDIDALPVQEETGAPYASRCEGKMHACGHDCHMAMLLGAAKILQEHREELKGDVRLLVQPAEEVCQGAQRMIDEGAMEGVDAVYGAHIWGNFDAPLIDVTPGRRMAGAELFTVTVEGTAAHCASPHLGHDAITAACAIVSNLQQYVSRMTDPFDPTVLNIGTFHGGTRFNIVANKAVLEGDLRAFTSGDHEPVIRRIVEGTAQSMGCKATVDYRYVVTPLINDSPEMNELARSVVTKLYGEESIGHMEVMLGSEDFSRYGEHAPHFFAFIGSRNREKDITYTNHHEKYDVDESVLQRGTAVMAQFAVDYLFREPGVHARLRP